MSIALRPISLLSRFATSARCFSSRAHPFGDAEKGAEDIYFNKEDQRSLSKLLKKVSAQTNAKDVEGAKTIEVNALKTIVGKYNVSPADITALLAWKETHY